MAAKRCEACGLFDCGHKRKAAAMNKSKFGSYYESPGWDAFVEKEAKVLGETTRNSLYSLTGPRKTERWPKSSPVPIDELLKSLNDALTVQGWSVDISPSISADDRRGFVISILEPTNVPHKKG